MFANLPWLKAVGCASVSVGFMYLCRRHIPSSRQFFQKRPISSPTSGPAALSGVRVVDLSRLLPGPYATQMLADLGAEVIKVEDPEGGELTRYLPPLAPDGTSLVFHSLNRGKKSVTLDLKNKDDIAQLYQLLETADVLMESFRPGVMERLIGDVSQLREKFPSLVICRISGFGQTGPDRLTPGHDVNYCARAGVLSICTPHPAPLPVQAADICGGAYPAVMQVLAALYQREKTQKGCYVDVSMTDGVHALMTMPLARSADVDSPDPHVGKNDPLSGSLPCYHVYSLPNDEHLAVGALEPHFWKKMLQVLEMNDLADKGFSEDPSERAAVIDVITKKLSTKTAAEWEAIFLKEGVPINRVRDLQETLGENSIPVSFGEKTLQLPRTPLTSELSSGMCTTPAPTLGSHNACLFSAKSIDDLRRPFQLQETTKSKSTHDINGEGSEDVTASVDALVNRVGLERAFELAVKFLATECQVHSSNQTKLKIYGLYKCATEGPMSSNTPEPSMFDMVKRAKYQAYKATTAGSKEEAKHQYLSLVETISAGWSEGKQ